MSKNKMTVTFYAEMLKENGIDVEKSSVLSVGHLEAIMHESKMMLQVSKAAFEAGKRGDASFDLAKYVTDNLE